MLTPLVYILEESPFNQIMNGTLFECHHWYGSLNEIQQD